MTKIPRNNLAERVYQHIKDDLAEFRLLPGDRFTETEVAVRVGVSRTPVREALYKLAQEGHIEVHSRNGWNVRPFDFQRYDHLYEVRIILELAGVERLCQQQPAPDLTALREQWSVPVAARLDDPHHVARLDEAFHETLAAATGNPELARLFRDITEGIRIVRRLDFTLPERIHRTYDEHDKILDAINNRRGEQAGALMRAHIETSKAEVRKITLHRLHEARQQGR